ncbi:MAG: DUF58 domain-containing protein [Lentisphaeria bacterium]|nr:DUF58 domain-containing protein [Lentisphaeria bacterium]NQZ66559.1 DUF58 domain-containing protein [Lentisphaeria bacterium]
MPKNSVTDLLNPQDYINVENLELIARTIVEGYLAGLHRGVLQGTGSEFVQYRNYNKGDDLRHLDWKAYSRLNKLVLKIYQEETNTNVNILLDSSASMNYAGEGRMRKFDYAKITAACVSYLVQKHGDSTGLTVFSDSLKTQIEASSRRDHFYRLCLALNEIEPEGNCDYQSMLRFISEQMKRRSLLIVISDFLDMDPKLMKMLKFMKAARHDIIVLHVLDDDELDFSINGVKHFIDSEDASEIITAPELVRDAYLEKMSAYLESFKSACLKNGISYQLLRNSDSFDKVFNTLSNRI